MFIYFINTELLGIPKVFNIIKFKCYLRCSYDFQQNNFIDFIGIILCILRPFIFISIGDIFKRTIAPDYWSVFVCNILFHHPNVL